MNQKGRNPAPNQLKQIVDFKANPGNPSFFLPPVFGIMKIGSVELLNIDCMEYMKTVPDKHFELAIVDPPYGINAGKMTLGKGKRKKFTQGKDWDSGIPSEEYFNELDRVSKNQIIWGGNYFDLPPTKY